MAHTHIHECSQKGANQPDSTLERNDTESHAGMLMEETHAGMLMIHTHIHTHTHRNTQKHTGMLLEERNTPP